MRGYDNYYLLYDDGSGWKVWSEGAGTSFTSDLEVIKDYWGKRHSNWVFIIVKEVFNDEEDR